VYLFGLILLYAAFKTMYDDDDDGNTHDDDTVKPSNSIIVRFISAFLPYTTNPTTTSFFLRSHHSKRLVATPMLAALLVVESTDILFAIDSIPCILGLTNDRYIVYTSNMFAILGLRSLYILLADALHRVKYLQTGLAFILGFVGFKMVVSEFFEISQTWSLIVIVSILVATVSYEKFSDRRINRRSKRSDRKLMLPKYHEACV
jgi:tellurite resistance protein TerC